MKNFRNFLNESGTLSSSITFRTEIKGISNIDVRNISQYVGKDVTDYPLEATVFWRVEPDFRSNRIKSMDLSIIHVVCDIEWDWEGGEENDIVHLDTSLPEFKDWSIESEIEFDMWGGVMPNSVEIDFGNKKINVK
jgi:hypothetical protein